MIDHDKGSRTSLAKFLSSAKFNVETFASVEDFLRESRAEKRACVLADIRTPDPTDFAVKQRVRWTEPLIPFIVMSASDDPTAREHARQLGAVGFFRKPVDDQALIDALIWAIESSAAQEKDTV